MGRPVVLSNGSLFVGLNERGLVHDFYYPYVGLDNLTTSRSLEHKIGVWVDGTFSWTDDGSWNISVDFEADALVSIISMVSEKLQVKLVFNDFVDSQYNAFIRRIQIENTGGEQQDVRIFMHQVFQISRAGRADTAMFVPDDDYILDYKGRCCLLIAGRATDGEDFDQYSVGNFGIEGKEGTFRDAEDGELSGNTVEHGGVDSVIRFRKVLRPHETFDADYWVVAAESQTDAQVAHTYLKYHSVEDRLTRTRSFFHEWLRPSTSQLEQLSDEHRIAVQKSMLVIKAHADKHGSVLASGDSSIFNYGRDYYCYCWPRDAAYALWPLIRLGQYDEARRFFAFARDTMHSDGYLMHKYQPDRAIGSTWHPMLHGKHKELAIQEDETASVLFMMGEYYRASQDRGFLEEFYQSFIVPAATFMSGFIDDATNLPHATYDLWEQKFLTSTYTVSTVIAGLETAVEFAEQTQNKEHAVAWKAAASRIRDAFGVLFHEDGYYRKGLLLQADGTIQYDDVLDISNLYGPFMFSALGTEDDTIGKTAAAIEARLLGTSPIGGVIRYEQDGYFLSKPQYKGNPWIVCTLWLAQYYLATHEIDKAKKLLDWALARRHPSGILSEQFDPEDGSPLGVAPLVWSHAELINTLLDYAKITNPI